jgi:hypothetical protein
VPVVPPVAATPPEPVVPTLRAPPLAVVPPVAAEPPLALPDWPPLPGTPVDSVEQAAADTRKAASR